MPDTATRLAPAYLETRNTHRVGRTEVPDPPPPLLLWGMRAFGLAANLPNGAYLYRERAVHIVTDAEVRRG